MQTNNKNSPLLSDCSHCLLANNCMPSGFPDDSVYLFKNIVNTNIKYKSSEIVYHQGEPTRHVYIVKSGSFKTFIKNDDQSEHITGFYLPGDCISMENMAEGVSLNTAQAVEDSLLCIADYPLLTKYRKEFPLLSDLAIKVYSGSLARSQDFLSCLAQPCAANRLATFLLIMLKRYNAMRAEQNDFQLNMSRQDIANYLGLAVETVSRSFSRLVDTGCITKKNRYICITNKEKLQQLASSQEA